MHIATTNGSTRRGAGRVSSLRVLHRSRRGERDLGIKQGGTDRMMRSGLVERAAGRPWSVTLGRTLLCRVLLLLDPRSLLLLRLPVNPPLNPQNPSRRRHLPAQALQPPHAPFGGRGTGKGMPLPHDGYGAIANGPSPVPSSDAHQREATRLVDPFGPSTAV